MKDSSVTLTVHKHMIGNIRLKRYYNYYTTATKQQTCKLQVKTWNSCN